jgi:hypothetical protein
MNIFINNRYRKIYNIDKTRFYVIYKKEKVDIKEYFKKNGVIKKKYNHLIQKKSKMFGGTDDTLVVCSLNVYTWATWYDYPHTFEKKFKELIDINKVELLLTQEDNIKDIDKNESVKAYSIGTEKSSRFNFISCIKTSPLLKGAVQRNAIFIEDKKFGIKIANVHLEGGRFIDLELDDTTFQTYLDTKLALLKELLELELPPDIILGDFNSVYCNDKTLLEQMYYGQKTYYDGRGYYQHTKEEEDTNKKDEKGLLQHISSTYGLQLIERCPKSDTIVISDGKKEVSDGKKEVSYGKKEVSGGKKVVSDGKKEVSDGKKVKKVLSFENIKSWNNAPFKLLQDKGYIYIEPENIIVDSKINPTNSKGKNVIDHIWVKETMYEKFTFKTKIYDGFGDATNDLYGMVSDHKPIILTITEKVEEKVAVQKSGPTKKKTTKRKRAGTT